MSDISLYETKSSTLGGDDAFDLRIHTPNHMSAGWWSDSDSDSTRLTEGGLGVSLSGISLIGFSVQELHELAKVIEEAANELS